MWDDTHASLLERAPMGAGMTAMNRLAVLTPLVLLGATVIVAARASLRTPPADVAADQRGRQIFQQRCAVCHTTGERAAQGPGLGGIVGRRAASTRFGYSPALRDANLTWDRRTLDRFWRRRRSSCRARRCPWRYRTTPNVTRCSTT
jgi:cytochrome c